jgi:hypothetical protein
MAPWRRPRGERLAESGRAQIRAVRAGRDTGEVPAGPGGGHPASHRAGDTRGISPPTYPCALERSTMSGKSREPSPSTDISDPAGSRETTERPGSCRPPVDVAKPDRRAAASSAQRWQIPESGTTAAVSAGRGPAPPSSTRPAASAGSRSGRSLSPTASPPSGSAAAVRGGSNPTVVPCQPCWHPSCAPVPGSWARI